MQLGGSRVENCWGSGFYNGSESHNGSFKEQVPEKAIKYGTPELSCRCSRAINFVIVVEGSGLKIRVTAERNPKTDHYTVQLALRQALTP